MNSEILEVVARSFYVSSVAILIASIFAVPLAVYISLAEFKGEILFDEKAAVNNNNLFRKNVGMVFQYPILLDRTVKENLAFGLKKRKEANIEKKVEEMIKQLYFQHIIFFMLIHWVIIFIL